jgi:hypothetical protein
VAAPVNAAVQRAVWDVANGNERPGLDLLRRVYDATRAGAAVAPRPAPAASPARPEPTPVAPRGPASTDVTPSM